MSWHSNPIERTTLSNHPMVIVIRAGGGGTRLWPVSRKAKPKQFHAFIDSRTLIRTTYERIAPVLSKPEDLFVSVSEGFEKHLATEIPELPTKNVIAEPAKKNTGPAVALEVAFLAERYTEDEIIATLPSDDYISNDEAFCNLLRGTEAFIRTQPDAIVTPGIKPTKVDTGYSYMKAGERLDHAGEEAVFLVADWVEKPDRDRCKQLIDSGIYYTHAGMYIWRLGTIRDLFQQLQPALYATCEKVAKLLSEGGKENAEQARELYDTLEEESIETTITDHAPKVAMSVSNRIGWSDLGKWHILQELLPKNEGTNVVHGAYPVLDDVEHSLIVAPKGKIVAAIGLHDLVIIDTPDALFISRKEDAGDVKQLVERLKAEERDDVI